MKRYFIVNQHCNQYPHSFIGITCAVMVFAFSSYVYAGQASSKNVTIRKSKNNLHFQVPPDWPIEERGGIVAPIPIEEYLAIKFQAIYLRLKRIENELSGMEIKMRVLENSVKSAGKKELRSSGGASEP